MIYKANLAVMSGSLYNLVSALLWLLTECFPWIAKI